MIKARAHKEGVRIGKTPKKLAENVYHWHSHLYSNSSKTVAKEIYPSNIAHCIDVENRNIRINSWTKHILNFS
jgi:hypothetical protein